MRVLLRFSLATAPLILFLSLATSASAECAWIAWNTLIVSGDRYGHNIPLTRLAAFSDRAECLAYVRARARWIPMAKENGAKVLDDTEGAQVQAANGTTSYFECWPDTVDPRESKGGR